MGDGPLLAVCAALVHDGKLLLGKRSPDKSFDQLKWALFGGHVQPGESSDDAIRRELCEELGVEVEDAEFIGTLSEMDETFRYLTDVYVVREWRGEPRNLQEHEEIRWAAPGQLAGLDLSPGLVEIIRTMGLLERL